MLKLGIPQNKHKINASIARLELLNKHEMTSPIASNAIPPPSGNSQTLILEAGRAERHYWADLWRYRELFAILAWRDVVVQYKQTVIGAAWALVRPLLTMIIFTVVFGKLAKLPSEGDVPYPVMVMAGMLPWFLFSTILGNASNSLVSNSNLIGKVYFPRLIVPVASAVVALVDFAITLTLLFIMMLVFGVLPDWRILFLPLFIALAVIASLGPALILTSLNVKYRDFRYIVPVIVAFGLYASPIIYETSMVPERFRLLYSLNPMAGVIEGFRWAILGTGAEVYAAGVAVSLAMQVVLLASGVWYFRRVERTFADVI